MARLELKKAIETGGRILNVRYSMSSEDMIALAAKGGCSAVHDAFLLGYCQGAKASEAEQRREAQKGGSRKMKKELYIDEKIASIELAAKKAKVLIEDLKEGYFCERIEAAGDFWRIGPPYYEQAGIRADIINDELFDLIRDLSDLRSLLDSEGAAKLPQKGKKGGGSPGGED